MVLPFEKEYREKYYKLLDEVFESNFWSDGKMTRTFEEKFGEFTELYSCAVTNAGSGLLSILEYCVMTLFCMIEEVRADGGWGGTPASVDKAILVILFF